MRFNEIEVDKSIFRHLFFKEATRQRGSWPFYTWYLVVQVVLDSSLCIKLGFSWKSLWKYSLTFSISYWVVSSEAGLSQKCIWSEAVENVSQPLSHFLAPFGSGKSKLHKDFQEHKKTLNYETHRSGKLELFREESISSSQLIIYWEKIL